MINGGIINKRIKKNTLKIKAINNSFKKLINTKIIIDYFFYY